MSAIVYPESRHHKPVQVAIIGASGYTGSELIRILFNHPEINIKLITSESHTGKKVSDLHPQFYGVIDFELQSADLLHEVEVDLVFLALPHSVSMRFYKEYGLHRFRVIDLSADFRIRSAAVYEQWYKEKHGLAKALKKAVYGLPELNRAKIRSAGLVANPGCYPTAAILALTPLLKHGLIDPKSIIIDAKSGVSGAGAKAKDSTHFPEVFGNFSAYSLHSHRHTPEIEETLNDFCKTETEILFTPHLLPIDRGILTTTYSRPVEGANLHNLQELVAAFYFKEQFVRVVKHPPALKHVRGSNYCDLFVSYDQRTNHIITVSTIDNLVKGAAGQAVQNMNIMFNLLESTALTTLPLSP